MEINCFYYKAFCISLLCDQLLCYMKFGSGWPMNQLICFYHVHVVAWGKQIAQIFSYGYSRCQSGEVINNNQPCNFCFTFIVLLYPRKDNMVSEKVECISILASCNSKIILKGQVSDWNIMVFVTEDSNFYHLWSVSFMLLWSLSRDWQIKTNDY